MVKDKQVKLVIGQIHRKNTTHYMQIGYTDGTTVWVIKIEDIHLRGNSKQIKKCIPKSKLYKIGTVSLGKDCVFAGNLTRSETTYITKILPILDYDGLRKLKLTNRYFNGAHTFYPYKFDIDESCPWECSGS